MRSRRHHRAPNAHKSSGERLREAPLSRRLTRSLPVLPCSIFTPGITTVTLGLLVRECRQKDINTQWAIMQYRIARVAFSPSGNLRGRFSAPRSRFRTPTWIVLSAGTDHCRRGRTRTENKQGLGKTPCPTPLPLARSTRNHGAVSYHVKSGRQVVGTSTDFSARAFVSTTLADGKRSLLS